MKRIADKLGAVALLIASNAFAEFPVPSGTYELENTHGYITFSYSHLGFSTPHVGFNSFDVTLDANSEDPTQSKVQVTIDAASIDSRVDEFDKHLNGADYFDTANHPEITFTSTGLVATGDNTFDVTGDLTVKGVTKPLTLAATVNKAANHPMRGVPTIGLSATGTISRSEMGLGALRARSWRRSHTVYHRGADQTLRGSLASLATERATPDSDQLVAVVVHINIDHADHATDSSHGRDGAKAGIDGGSQVVGAKIHSGYAMP